MLSLLWALGCSAGCLNAQEFALMDKGWRHYENDQYDSAIHYFNESLKKYPNEHFALKLRGQAYAHLGDCQHAIIDFSEALKHHVDSIETLSARIKCYYETSKFELVVADATTILEIDVSNRKKGTAFYYRALALYSLKKYGLADNDADELLKVDSLNDVVLLLKAECQIGDKDAHGALITTQKILSQFPSDAKAHIVRGFAWASLGNREEILKEARLAMNGVNNDAGNLARIALLFTLTFENEMAEAVAKQSVALDPSFGLGHTSLGVAEVALHKYPEAIKTLTKAISIEPSLAINYMRRGQSYYMLKDYTRAHKDLYKAQQLDPSQPETFMFIGYVFHATKNQSQACRYWKIAFEKGGTDIGEEIKIYCK